MYTCGPTVYRYAHVGNLRSNLLADLIRRVALYHGIDVVHVKNVTDVGHLRDEGFDRGADPMLVAGRTRAQDAGRDRRRLRGGLPCRRGRRSTSCPRTSSRAPPSTSRRCSTLAEALEDAGYAYATRRGQRLLRRRRGSPATASCRATRSTDLRAGHRGEIEPDKRDPADFALWKAAGPGRLLKWPTPRWGEGFPGWHLECSAMAMRYLGPRFDIHTGGIDNVFPHHEDEIAQSAAITGDVPARHWVHGEFLLMDGKKMAKSAGNFQRVTELVERGIDPLAFRYLVLTSRYSRKLEYSDRSLAAAGGGTRIAPGRTRARSVRRRPTVHGPLRHPLRAGRAGDRPAGVARVSPVTAAMPDRASCWPTAPRPRRSPVARRPRPPRSFRRRDRRRPRHAGRARAAARDPAGADRRRRASLARPRCRCRPGSRPPPRLG